MLSGNLGAWERSLAAHLAKVANKRLAQPVTLIEVIDVAALWTDPMSDLAPALTGQDFQTLMEDFPIVGCAAATEIGCRFEGVGTVFWGKFEGLLGSPVPMAKRPLLSRAFSNLADRFALQRPSDSGFANQFSIIAWPIANALIPYELAGPVGRLMARGPGSGLSAATSSRRQDLAQLRAWAQSWEGARLADWLHEEGPAQRVIAALLTDNAKGGLPPATFTRLAAAFLHHSEAYFALREARRRKPAASAPPEATTGGQLSLQRHGEAFLLSVAWPAMGTALADQGRQEASAHGWRPKLWDQARTASDNVFGGLPIALRLTALPQGDAPVHGDLAAVFGEASPVADILSARRVNWDSPLIFLADGAEAEQIHGAVTQRAGELWILDRQGQWAELPRHGTLADAIVRRADLADAGHRAILAAHGWAAASSQTAASSLAIARDPLDALTLPRRQVSAQATFCLYGEDTVRVERLRRRETSAHGLTVGAGREAGPAAPGVFLFERETAFDALVEQRLIARLQSAIPGARWPVEVMLLIDEEILAYAADTLGEDDQGLSAASRLVQVLQDEPVRRRVLEAGRATLRVRVGRHPWDTIPLRRQDGDLDWTHPDPAQSLTRPAAPVAAPARAPYRLDGTATSTAVWLRAYQYEDGRLAAPGRIEAPDHLNLGDLSSDFSPIAGRRRLRADGGGLLDLARARRGWASAQADSLTALAARIRVVRQFERPLVAALCGPQWCELEDKDTVPAPLGERLLDHIAPDTLGDHAGLLEGADLTAFAARFSAAIDLACPDWAEDGEIDDECADTALNAAFVATLVAAQAEGRLLATDAEDVDFGASADQWRTAARAAIDTLAHAPLVALIAPTSGARVLAARRFTGRDLAEASGFLVDWTQQWCLPRSHLSLDLACGALQIWLSPSVAEPEGGALAVMSRDVFLARAVRLMSLRMAAAA